MKLSIFVILILIASLHATELIKPIPTDSITNKQKVALGKKLFFDARLSKDDTISCNSCHDVAYNGADKTALSFGVDGQAGQLNSPTLFNALYNIAQFWDGRASDLKEQVKGPLFNHVEMATNEKELVNKLSQDKKYVNLFFQIYGDAINLNNISDAIAEFEKTLITPNSKFDLFLKGDLQQLSQQEKEGYKLFKNFGCVSCHNGVNIGSNMFQKFGIFAKYDEREENLGRYNVTKDENDKYYFKVPALRNITKTSPYFHNGSVEKLENAIKIMGYYQLGKVLSNEEITSLALFLKTLDGELP